MADKEELVYTKPTSQVDMEARLSDDSEPPAFNESTNPNPFHEDGFVGVGLEYANAANDVDEPLQAEEGPDKMAEDAFDAAYGPASGEPTPRAQEAHDKVTTDLGTDAPTATPAKTTTTKKTASSSS